MQSGKQNNWTNLIEYHFNVPTSYPLVQYLRCCKQRWGDVRRKLYCTSGYHQSNGIDLKGYFFFLLNLLLTIFMKLTGVLCFLQRTLVGCRESGNIQLTICIVSNIKCYKRYVSLRKDSLKLLQECLHSSLADSGCGGVFTE